MDTDVRRKTVNRDTAPAATPEVELERAVREHFVAMLNAPTVRAKRAAARPRVLYLVAEGKQHPTRTFARLARRLKLAGVPHEMAREALVGKLDDYLARTYRVRPGAA